MDLAGLSQSAMTLYSAASKVATNYYRTHSYASLFCATLTVNAGLSIAYHTLAAVGATLRGEGRQVRRDHFQEVGHDLFYGMIFAAGAANPLAGVAVPVGLFAYDHYANQKNAVITDDAQKWRRSSDRYLVIKATVKIVSFAKAVVRPIGEDVVIPVLEGFGQGAGSIANGIPAKYQIAIMAFIALGYLTLGTHSVKDLFKVG